MCKTDPLSGMKEQILIWGIIPVGTGLAFHTEPSDRPTA